MESGIAEYRFIMEGLRMKEVVRQIINGTLLVCILLVAAACSHDTDAPDVSTDNLILSVSFRAAAPPEGYENGSTYENYIGSYRIYFFDVENKFIAEFTPNSIKNVDGTDYMEYTVFGKAPDALVKNGGNFKVVVAANWPTYPQTIAPETTIEEFCSADYAKFSIPTSFVLSENNLIPFYGVHVYTGVAFKPGERVELAAPITLLRAMAKVEVIIDYEKSSINLGESQDFNFGDVSVFRYNAKGYCAPAGVDDKTDYDHDGIYNQDYVKHVHLVGGANEIGDKSIPFADVTDGSGKVIKKVIYLPEYDNSVVDNQSYIQVKFDFQEEGEKPYEIHFAEYTNGVSGTPFNIERNNLYRFTITVNGNFAVVVRDWTNVYENNFEF